MPRTRKAQDKRKIFTPILARAFAELGFRRTTTAELARRCNVQENILYRLWPDKKSMFLDAIEHVYQLSRETWRRLLEEEDEASSRGERILAYESRHHGEFGFYRIVFAGLSETDDPDIRRTLKSMYRRFHRFIRSQIAEHRDPNGKDLDLEIELSAWAIVGLGTVANITRELDLLSNQKRKQLFDRIGKLLLEGRV